MDGLRYIHLRLGDLCNSIFILLSALVKGLSAPVNNPLVHLLTIILNNKGSQNVNLYYT